MPCHGLKNLSNLTHYTYNTSNFNDTHTITIIRVHHNIHTYFFSYKTLTPACCTLSMSKPINSLIKVGLLLANKYYESK